MTAAFELRELASAGVAALDCEHKTPAACVDGFPYIAIPDVQDGRVVIETARRISAADLEEWTRRTVPQPGDIIVTRRARVGDTAPIPGGIRCAIGQNLVLLRSDGSQVLQVFLRWAVRSPQWWSEVERLMNVGAVFSSLNVRDIAKIKLPVPPMAQQQAIAEVLDALDDKIAANTKLVEAADQLAESITRRALDMSEMIELSTIADIVMGSSPLGTSFNDSGEGTVFYQGVRDFGVRFPTNRIWTSAPVRFAIPGDTLLSVRAPVGRVNLATEETCIGRGVASVRSSTGRPFTLFHVLKDSQEAWAPFEAEGTVFGSINKGQLAALQVPSLRPGQEEQLEGQLAPIELAIALALGENIALAATRDALLPQLMSGKLRVKEAEALVAAAV